MEDTTMTMATPAKLKSGAWGARVNGQVKAGDMVTIKTAAGKTWLAKIEKVVWSGAGVSICATQSLDRDRPSRRMGSGHGRAASIPGYSGYCTDNEYCTCYDCAS